MEEYPKKEKAINISVTVKAMSELSRILGWSEKEVKFEGVTLEELLRSLMILNGQSLYSFLVKNGKPKAGYVISINGKIVNSLETPLNYGDRIVTMEIVRLFHGG
jgi:sulfur carrier protein ThiS